ncbi:beta-lactamase/transpeptidase-like protein [Karstenula rhodostoma CBS 690.94]|uniref:Beta-lactamase/transpeptidase-like protein n=1 Tax=Karstenula rhodostoma CBS 690.94 TaxID=1392251 RepID=A0A9P4U4S5_9PLEO|nr:beta-lactamase/transpeptidase-like protein [Karstenula rhodostoma CBS 690.94]
MDYPILLIERLKSIYEDAGAAIAILHHGRLLHFENIGFRDLKSGLPVNDETIFPCASLTKAVVPAVVASYVEEGSFTWDTPVKDILQNFHTRDATLHQHMTPVDCLSHRAGMQSSLYWLGSDNNVLISNQNSMNFINDLQRVVPFRNGYLYNNLGYELAVHVLTKMTRTGTRAYFDGGDNVAKTYGTLDDASNVAITPMLSGDNTVGGPGSAMRSCIKDLIKLYASFLAAGKHQLATGETKTPGSPIQQVASLWSSKISMDPISFHETTYALGWARVQTPGPMGAIGLNPDLLSPKPAPYVAREQPSHLVIYHQGSMPGNLAAVNLLPATGGAIIVLTNSLALNDAADWLGQLYSEAYLGVRKRHDYVALAKETVQSALEWHPRLIDELKAGQIRDTQARKASENAGILVNEARTMMIKVFVDDQDSILKLSFQGMDNEIFPLTHYHHDTFTWLVTRNKFARRGRFTNDNAEYFKVNFLPDPKSNKIEHLTWWHNKWLPKAEMFSKEST